MGCALQKQKNSNCRINNKSGSIGLIITTNSPSELKNKRSKSFFLNQISFKLSNITESTIIKRRYLESPVSNQ